MTFDAETLLAMWNNIRLPRNTTWTPERRAAQALRCRQNQPWTRSTGPRTPQGKARSRLNGSKKLKRAAQEFDIIASFVSEIDRLTKENAELKTKLDKLQNEPYGTRRIDSGDHSAERLDTVKTSP